MFTTAGAHGCSRKLRIEGQNLHENKHVLPENQDTDISAHWAFVTIRKKKKKNEKK